MRRRRAIGLTALVVLGGLVGAYALAWRWAAAETARTLDDWIAREARVGRNWTCPGQTIAGFPTRIVLTCKTPRFEGEIAERHYVGTLGGFEAEASLLHPRTLRTALVGPFALGGTDGSGGRLTLTWRDLTVDLGGSPAGLEASALAIDSLSVALDDPDLGHLRGTADRVVASITARPDRTDRAYDVGAALEGGHIPLFDAVLGDPGVTALALQTTVSQLDFKMPGSVATRMEAWRTAGGRWEIATLRLAHGATSVGGTGTFGLDGAHRPDGRLDARFVGLEPVLRRFGVDPGIVAATGLIGSLLGGGRPAGRTDDGGGLRLPVTLSGGRVTVGPVRTPLAVPPLY